MNIYNIDICPLAHFGMNISCLVAEQWRKIMFTYIPVGGSKWLCVSFNITVGTIMLITREDNIKHHICTQE